MCIIFGEDESFKTNAIKYTEQFLYNIYKNETFPGMPHAHKCLLDSKNKLSYSNGIHVLQLFLAIVFRCFPRT